jgi:DNA-binding NarL/FixJ family response regulator
VNARTPALPALVLSAYAENQCALQAFNAGGDGFINKENVAGVLIAATRQVISGKKYFILCLSTVDPRALACAIGSTKALLCVRVLKGVLSGSQASTLV